MNGVETLKENTDAWRATPRYQLSFVTGLAQVVDKNKELIRSRSVGVYRQAPF